MHGKRSRKSPHNAGRQSPDEVLEKDNAAAAAAATPTKKVCLNVAHGEEQEVVVQVNNAETTATTSRVVTPATTTNTATAAAILDHAVSPARRALFAAAATTARSTTKAVPITPSSSLSSRRTPTSPAKRRLLFGRLVEELHVQENVRQVYKIVKRLTGSLGGNASEGPIYGELTMHSMQKMINLMKKVAKFDCTSRFIDVGSGIGKPSLHVTQDPGVCFSYGVEVEESRWLLGMSCLKGMLEAAADQQQEGCSSSLSHDKRIHHHCVFEKGDIRQAKIFDPFTHVYMFSIGFPPMLWIELAKIWNRSSSPYLICYHGPKDIIDTYEFDVELIAQKQTSMHGSKEGHMGYIYKRKANCAFDAEACDPAFKSAFEKAQQLNVSELRVHVEQELDRLHGTRARRSRS